jgi:acyl-CoA thioester hydrolase
MSETSSSFGAEVWRGGACAWECDEMGHMNVRHYVAKAMEGLAGLAAALGLPRAFAPDADATLIVREHHVRFLKEAHAGAPLYMRGWVTRMGACDAALMFVLRHSLDGAVAATFQAQVTHATARDGRPFPWPQKALERAAGLMGPVPDFAAPRGVDMAFAWPGADVARADALGLATLGLGAVAGAEADAFGRMRAELFIGRISDGILHLTDATRRAVAAHLDEPVARIGGAVLESRLAYFDLPRIGDRFVIRSALSGADHRTLRFIHWLLDPETGRPWGAAQGVSAIFDLDRRRIVPITPAARAELAELTIPSLAP